MVKTGRLEIDHNSDTSRLNAGPGDRKRLARIEGGDNPFRNATRFLEDVKGLDDGDFIFVTEDLASRVIRMKVDQKTAASDHQPILIELAD